MGVPVDTVRTDPYDVIKGRGWRWGHHRGPNKVERGAPLPSP